MEVLHAPRSLKKAKNGAANRQMCKYADMQMGNLAIGQLVSGAPAIADFRLAISDWGGV
jgi:hypothetical protein